jgi:hypothetical protein
MNTYSKYISDIIEAKNNGTLAIFVGAGVSKCANNNFPTWSEIINCLKNELNEKNENDFSKIAQLYYMKFGEFVYLKKIQEFFPDYYSSSSVHKLIFDINPDVIITTNFDNLLEKTIEEYSYNYDIIRCDDDLVKSFLPKKLIKMHGDFEKNNIVFKEDDYLNYQYNFPLIENYIKSILSTHTILFLGYSYSDIDLKQIIMWLKNFSKVQPPKYLTVINDDPNQTKYLENHGIYNINLNELNKGNELKINNKNEPSFKDKYENILNLIKNEDKFNLIKENNDPIEFVYNKLKIYEHFNYVLQDHIKETLTNCGFIYEDEKTILKFYNHELSNDINKEVIDIYQNFLKEINNKFENNEINDTINKIFEILKKANIDGILINKNKYIPIQEKKDSFIESILNFDFDSKQLEDDDYYLLKKSFIQYQIQNYDLAYQYNEEALKNYLKQKNYFLYYISIFNKSILNYLINKEFNNFNNVEYDYLNLLEKEYNKPPNYSKKSLKPIYNFFNYNYIFEIYYKISEELKNKENSKRLIKSGGYTWRKNITFSNSIHKNIIYFTLGNTIIIENYTEFKNLIEKFLNISIISQTFKDITEFNKIELYSAIKFIKNNELLSIFIDFYENDEINRRIFQISDENKSWLINIVFKNIVQYYINEYNGKDIFDGYETYLQNIIFIISLLELNNYESNIILNNFIDIIESKNMSFNIYIAMDIFFASQYNLYKNKLDSNLLLNLIYTIIYKFIIEQYNGYNLLAITNNKLTNLFEYAKFQNVIFDDDKTTDLLLNKCDILSIDEKVDISTFLLNIYDLSTDSIKNKIKNFIINIPAETIDNKGKYLIFKFTLIERNFIKLDSQIISDLDEYLKQFENLKTFSSYLENINDYLDYLIEKMNYKELLPASQKVKNLIEKYNKNKPESIF